MDHLDLYAADQARLAMERLFLDAKESREPAPPLQPLRTTTSALRTGAALPSIESTPPDEAEAETKFAEVEFTEAQFSETKLKEALSTLIESVTIPAPEPPLEPPTIESQALANPEPAQTFAPPPAAPPPAAPRIAVTLDMRPHPPRPAAPAPHSPTPAESGTGPLNPTLASRHPEFPTDLTPVSMPGFDAKYPAAASLPQVQGPEDLSPHQQRLPRLGKVAAQQTASDDPATWTPAHLISAVPPSTGLKTLVVSRPSDDVRPTPSLAAEMLAFPQLETAPSVPATLSGSEASLEASAFEKLPLAEARRMPLSTVEPPAPARVRQPGFPSEEAAAARWEQNRREASAKAGLAGISLDAGLLAQGPRSGRERLLSDNSLFDARQLSPHAQDTVIPIPHASFCHLPLCGPALEDCLLARGPRSNSDTLALLATSEISTPGAPITSLYLPPASVSTLRNCGPAVVERGLCHFDLPTPPIDTWNAPSGTAQLGHVAGSARMALTDQPAIPNPLRAMQLNLPDRHISPEPARASESSPITAAPPGSGPMSPAALRAASTVARFVSHSGNWVPAAHAQPPSWQPWQVLATPLVPSCHFGILGPQIPDPYVRFGSAPARLESINWSPTWEHPRVPRLKNTWVSLEFRGAALVLHAMKGATADRTEIRPFGPARYSPVAILMMPPVDFDLPRPTLCEEDRLVERRPVLAARIAPASHGFRQPAAPPLVLPTQLARPWTRKNRVQGPITNVISAQQGDRDQIGVPRFTLPEPVRRHPADFFIWPVPLRNLPKTIGAQSSKGRHGKDRFQFGVKPPARETGKLGLKAG
ncbi:MAG: hypothetical protein ABI811_11095 [Acidobacteriota bacterium]